jgi:hypothetical protein
MNINESVMQENRKKKDANQRRVEDSEEKSKDLTMDYWYIGMIYAFGFSTIHSFYPNMSNFL